MKRLDTALLCGIVLLAVPGSLILLLLWVSTSKLLKWGKRWVK